MPALDPTQPPSWLLNPSAALAPSPRGATPTPADKSKEEKPKESTPSSASGGEVVKFPTPQSGMGQEAALAAIGRLEQERQAVPPPKMERPQKPTTPQEDAQLWGAIGIAFAALASRRTRTPMTAALNGASAAIQAMQQGQKEKADQSFKQWEMDTRFALENFNYEQRAYEDMMDNISRRENVAMTVWGKLDQEDEIKFRTLTQSLQDPEMMAAYDQGGVKGAVGLQQTREKQAEKLKEATLEATKNGATWFGLQTMQESPEWKAAVANRDTAAQMKLFTDVVNKTNPTKRMMNDDQVTAAAKRVINLQEPYPGRGSAYTQADREAVIDKVGELSSDYSATDFPTKQKVQQEYATGPGSVRVQSMNTLAGHLNTLEDLAQKLPQTDTKLSQQLFTSIARQWDPSVTNFDAAKVAVADEFNKVLIASGAGTGEDRNRWVQIFDVKTPEQMKGAIDTAKDLVRSRVEAELNRALNPKYGLKASDIMRPEQLKFWGLNEQGKPVEGPVPAEETKTTKERTGPGASKDNPIYPKTAADLKGIQPDDWVQAVDKDGKITVMQWKDVPSGH